MGIKLLEVARKLFNMQRDISYCNQEIEVYDIETLEDAIRFLDWVLKEENFEYEFQK